MRSFINKTNPFVSLYWVDSCDDTRFAKSGPMHQNFSNQMHDSSFCCLEIFHIACRPIIMATSLDNSFDSSEIVLDLDDVSNTGHPILEILDPNPNVHQLHKKYSKIFFDGLLDDDVDLKWVSKLSGSCAACTYPYQKNVHGNSSIRIHLNEELMRKRLRREIIEILLVRGNPIKASLYHQNWIEFVYKLKLNFNPFSSMK